MNLPDWLEIKPFNRKKYSETLKLINDFKLNTVCLSANCPNRYECFCSGTATFMILGDICTRNCRYCNIKQGKPLPPDEKEPQRISQAVKKMNLKYAVITCVTRDDLADGGAEQFCKVVKEIKKTSPACKIELLISDLKGNWPALKKIIISGPCVINHNIETVRELFPSLRRQGNYDLSLLLLKKTKKLDLNIKTKSGIILGLGETKEQIINTFNDLRLVGCNFLTIGQYLQPSPNHAPVKKYWQPAEFSDLQKIAESLGFEKVNAGPLVRSSYNAWKNTI